MLFNIKVLFLYSVQRYEKPLFTSESYRRVLEKHKRTFNNEQVTDWLEYTVFLVHGGQLIHKHAHCTDNVVI